MVQSIIKHSFAVGTDNPKVTPAALATLEEEFLCVFGRIDEMVIHHGGEELYRSAPSSSTAATSDATPPPSVRRNRMQELRQATTKVSYDGFAITICWGRSREEKTKVLASLFLRFSLHILLCLSTPCDKALSLAKRLVDLSTLHVGVSAHDLGSHVIRSGALLSLSRKSDHAMVCTVECDPYFERLDEGKRVSKAGARDDTGVGAGVGEDTSTAEPTSKGETGSVANGKRKSEGEDVVYEEAAQDRMGHGRRQDNVTPRNKPLDIHIHGTTSWQYNNVVHHKSSLRIEAPRPASPLVAEILEHHMRKALQKCSDTMLLWKQCNGIFEILCHRDCELILTGLLFSFFPFLPRFVSFCRTLPCYTSHLFLSFRIFHFTLASLLYPCSRPRSRNHAPRKSCLCKPENWVLWVGRKLHL